VKRQSRTSIKVADEVEERARIMACVKLGLEESEKVDAESTLGPWRSGLASRLRRVRLEEMTAQNEVLLASIG